MLYQYKTVEKTGEHEIVIERSRFICHAKRVTTEEDAQQFIQELKKKYWDATHNCSAYLIGEHNLIQKAHDDGEPSGTAGVPMLEVLKKLDIKDTVVVVTRYFGGIKLGAGGLVRAYSRSVKEGLVNIGVVERTLMHIIRVAIDYTFLGKIENEVRNSNYTIKEIFYTDKVELDCYVDAKEIEAFHEFMTNCTNGNCHISETGVEYLEKNVNL